MQMNVYFEYFKGLKTLVRLKKGLQSAWNSAWFSLRSSRCRSEGRNKLMEGKRGCRSKCFLPLKASVQMEALNHTVHFHPASPRPQTLSHTVLLLHQMDHDPRNPTYISSQGPLLSTVVDFWQVIVSIPAGFSSSNRYFYEGLRVFSRIRDGFVWFPMWLWCLPLGPSV